MALKDAKKCNAKSKSTGKQCQCVAVTGSDKCRVHGGKTPRGVANANYKHGKFSEHLPSHFASIYANVESDIENGLLSRNIKLRETLIRQKLELLEDAPDSQKAWNELRTLIDDVHMAYSKMDDGKMALTLTKINRLLDARILYHLTVAEIRNELNGQREDMKAIAAIEYKGENAATMTEIMQFVGAVLKLVDNTVSNIQERNKIFYDIESIIGTKERDTATIERLSASS